VGKRGARYDIARLKIAVPAAEIGHDPSCLLYHKTPRSHVPGAETYLEKTVASPCCKIGKVKGGGAGPAQIAGLEKDVLKEHQVVVDMLLLTKGESRCHERPALVQKRRYL